MRHSVNILFGQDLADSACALKKYALNYGEVVVNDYFNLIHWLQTDNGDIKLSSIKRVEVDDDEFIAGQDDKVQVTPETQTIAAEDKIALLTDYFDNLCRSTITSGNTGDYTQLHFCLYFTLYEPELWQQAKLLVETLKSLKNRETHIDLVGFSDDLSCAIHGEEPEFIKGKRKREIATKATIREIVKYRHENQGNIYHFIVMQNTQTGGVSLNLSKESFIRVIGEYAMLCIENYQAVFGIAPPESDLQSFGLSVLHFDRYYFVEYLLHKAYIFAMEREGIFEDKVDINLALNKANDILRERQTILSHFLETEISPRMRKSENTDQIVQDSVPLLNDKLADLEKHCDDIINDMSLSIPDKRAILAALFGFDDELFVNNVFADDMPIIDDLNSEAMKMYIDANNALLDGPLSSEAILSKRGESIEYNLPLIKQLHIEMQRRIGYIRDLESEKKSIENQIGNFSESKKCYIENGVIVVDGRKIRLLPAIDEEPLTESYTPRNITKTKSIDLRSRFNNVKDQGEQGSCLAFALTAVNEFILKNSSDRKEKKVLDLSEAFLYYNAREKAGDTQKDAGCTFRNAVDALVEYGICLEELCKYEDTLLTEKPAKRAYDDALSRRVKKALNVNHNIDDIRSALADGYPVIVSLNVLFPSFAECNRGFVHLPSEEEITKSSVGHSYHSMVIVGYDDEHKFFAVRNSWGTGFGDKGYCYIPYLYVSDKRLFHSACIISEVETGKTQAENEKSVLVFDETDANIRIELIKNAIAEENYKLNNNLIRYNALRTEYEQLKLTLKNSNNQVIIREATERRIELEIEDLEAQYSACKSEKYSKLEDFDYVMSKTVRRLALISLGILGVVLLLAYFVGWEVYKWDYTWYSFGTILLIVLVLFYLYFPYRKRLRDRLEEEFDEKLERIDGEIARKKQELKELRIRMFFAGHYLTKLFKVQSALEAKRLASESLLNNLKAWYKEEQNTLASLNAETQFPFIPLLRNEVLDKFFTKNSEQITDSIALCKTIVEISAVIVNQTINKTIINQSKKRIKQQCIAKIHPLLNGFNVYSAICDKSAKYDYLDVNQHFISTIISKLDEKSKVFLCDNGSILTLPNKLILIYSPTDEAEKNWIKYFPYYFSEQPNAVPLLSTDKLIIFRLTDLDISQIN
jgi:C1A family cysteine protease